MYNEFAKPKFATVITAVMLIATTAISNITTGSVLAYDKNQAKSDINECGNGQVPTNIGCQNIDSQIQGDENSVALAGVQTFPEPQTCLECFTTFLTSEQITALEPFIASGGIEDLCAFLEGATPEDISQSLVQLADILASNPDPGDPSGPPIADDLTIEQLVDCLERVFGLA
jgi:hypothetical protein